MNEAEAAGDEFREHTVDIWEMRAEEVVDYAKAEGYARAAATAWARVADEIRSKATAVDQAAGNDGDPEAAATKRMAENAALDV